MRTKDTSRNQKSATTRPPPPTVPTKQIKMKDSPSRDEIARRAHAMYVDQGRPHGQDVQHWLAAEAQVIKSHMDAGKGIVL